MAACAVLAFMLVFSLYPKVYDLSTAASFALGLAWMVRGKWAPFLLSFPLMCLNRETAALLTVIYAVHFWGRLAFGRWMLMGLTQAAAWSVTRLFVVWSYAGNAGQDIYLRLFDNLKIYGHLPLVTALHWIALAWLVRRVFLSLKRAHPLLKCAWLVLFPVLLMEYVVFGFPFEVRVFSEVWAVGWLLAFSVVKNSESIVFQNLDKK